jgi:hypothetical protein
MSRELRRVPPNWVHPRRANGRYEPLHDKTYREACEEREAFRAAWQGDGIGLSEFARKQRDAGDEMEEWEPYVGSPEDYRPDWPEDTRTAFQYYETVSEGTPVSPVFETLLDLAQHLALEHGGPADRWLKHLEGGGYLPSAIGVVGVGILSGEEALARGVL